MQTQDLQPVQAKNLLYITYSPKYYKPSHFRHDEDTSPATTNGYVQITLFFDRHLGGSSRHLGGCVRNLEGVIRNFSHPAAMKKPPTSPVLGSRGGLPAPLQWGLIPGTFEHDVCKAVRGLSGDTSCYHTAKPGASHSIAHMGRPPSIGEPWFQVPCRCRKVTGEITRFGFCEV